jgi:surface antigen
VTGWGAWAIVPAFLVHTLWGASGQGAGPATSPTWGGYPYASATCEFGAQGGPACADPGRPGDLYNWGYRDARGGEFRPSDPWGYEYRNCTSYVAWRLSRAGVPAALFTGLGNASQWIAGVAREPGVVVNDVPAPGAIAVWVVATGVGHVAWVDSAGHGNAGRNGAVLVSDYNYAGTGVFATHQVTSPPTGYIHFPPRGVT